MRSIENDMGISSGKYTSTSGQMNFLARYAGWNATISIYNGGTTAIGTFSGSKFIQPDRTLAASYSVSATELFGMMADIKEGATPRGTWYSEIGLNSPADGKYHFVLLNTPYSNKFLVGLEDQTDSTGADWDYNDAVFELVNIYPVPEPGTMSLLGLGVLGLFGMKRRKKIA